MRTGDIHVRLPAGKPRVPLGTPRQPGKPSMCHTRAADHCMFSGDVLFQGSIGRADLTGGNFDELIEHICSRLFILPNDTIVYPGHGAPTTIGIEKAENPFFR